MTHNGFNPCQFSSYYISYINVLINTFWMFSCCWPQAYKKPPWTLLVVVNTTKVVTIHKNSRKTKQQRLNVHFMWLTVAVANVVCLYHFQCQQHKSIEIHLRTRNHFLVTVFYVKKIFFFFIWDRVSFNQHDYFQIHSFQVLYRITDPVLCKVWLCVNQSTDRRRTLFQV